MSALAACTLALVLLMDVSGSVRDREYLIQRDATAQALVAPEVVRLAERRGGIAVSTIMYSYESRVVTPWRILDSNGSAQAIAEEIRAVRRPMKGQTFTGAALMDAMRHLESAPCREEMVIDVSTDGPGDDFNQLATAREQATLEGIQINGLAIQTRPQDMTDAEISERAFGIIEWMHIHLITPDGFVVEAQDWEQYPGAIRRKLIREIAELRSPG